MSLFFFCAILYFFGRWLEISTTLQPQLPSLPVKIAEVECFPP